MSKMDDGADYQHEEKPQEGSEKTLVPSEEEMADPIWQEAEKSLVRKLDMTLLPIVWLLYMFNYLDRNNIAYVTHPPPPSPLPLSTAPDRAD